MTAIMTCSGIRNCPRSRPSGRRGAAGFRWRKWRSSIVTLRATYPELFEGSNFSDWLYALQNAKVAVHCHTGAMIAITEKGLLILEHLEEAHIIN